MSPKAKPRVLMIGALPPPAIGPYLAMQRLVQSPVLQAAFTVDFLDISDRRAPTNIGRLDLMNLILGLKHVGQCLGRLLFHPPALVYLGISQGTWGYIRDLAFIVPALCLGRRLILHLRGSEFRTYYDAMPGWLRWLTRWMLARTARVIVLGASLKPIFAGLVPPERVVAIPNGIDFQAFTRPATEAGRPPGKRILFLSSLRKRKGLFLLLEALPALFSRHADATVTLAGLWQSDAERLEAEAVITRLGLSRNDAVENGSAHVSRAVVGVPPTTGIGASASPNGAASAVAGPVGATPTGAAGTAALPKSNESFRLRERLNFVGEVTGPEKIQLFHQHDVFVFPPVEPEGLPWVILEAMSAALPVVTTDQGAIAEVVVPGQSGFIVSPDAAAVAERVSFLLDHPAEARAMGARARSRIENNFSEAAYLARLMAVFEEVAGGSAGSLVRVTAPVSPATPTATTAPTAD